MKQQKFIDLINTSQAIIKTELLPTAHNKYQLLMIMRSFELLKGYILEKESYTSNVNHLLQQSFELPIADNPEALQLLSRNIREGNQDTKLFTTLEALNNEELKITNPKVAKNG